MKLILIILLGYSALTMANNPDHFNTKNSKAVFVDFTDATTHITYDANSEKVYAKTKINFIQSEKGTPIFDLVESINDIRINGKKTNALEIRSPDRETKYKTITTQLVPGKHTLEIKNMITENIRFSRGGVQSAFWMSDLSDRTYLEQYIPTNIEYDQYQINLNIKFTHTKNDQVIYTNGTIKKIKKNTFQISYPKYFTASSLYFHTASKGRFKEVKTTYQSISGKTIPVTIYSRSSWSLNSAKKRSLEVIKELENKIGQWSHPQFIAYIAGQGGMEYSGATITSMRALGHEITHSFFARGVMPIDGNSGWMDEAIASWRDKGYQSTSKPSFNSSAMANHSQYRRTTDRKAYSQGANFMAYLNHNLTNLGGLEAFLALMHKKYVHKNIHTDLFRKELEKFSGLNFEADFNQYIFGDEKSDSKKGLQENPYHPKLSKEQLKSLL